MSCGRGRDTPLSTRLSIACSTSDACGAQKCARRCVTRAVSSASVRALLALRHRTTAPFTALARIVASSLALSRSSTSACLAGAATFAATRLCLLRWVNASARHTM